MADFVAVLKKTLDGIGDPTPETRQRVYERARATVMSKLQAISPPPPKAVADKQVKALEDAILVIEKSYAPPGAKKADPLDELEDVFASLNGLRERTTIPPRPTPSETKPLPTGPFTSQVNQRAGAAVSPPPAPGATASTLKPATRPVTTPSQPPRATSPVVAPPLAPSPVVDANDDLEPAVDAADEEYGAYDEPIRRRRWGSAIAAALALAVLAGGAYAVWLNKDDFSRMVGLTPPADTVNEPLQTEPSPVETAAAETPAPEQVAAASTGAINKLTQRLNEDGSEIDPGPAGGTPSVGEGTTVAEVSTGAAASAPLSVAPVDDPAEPADAPAAVETTTPDATPPSETTAAAAPELPAPAAETAPAAEPAPATPTPAAPAPAPTTTAAAETPAAAPSLAVGQKAIFYEERTSSAQGSAEPGTTVWSIVQESPGGDRPPEPAIRGETTIPGKEVQLRMTIRRNADPTLPASHIIEMIFLTPENFDGGGVANVLRVAMKGSEQDAGNPLIGIPAKIADGFFLVALNDNKAEIDANMNLLLRQSWIDIPIVYGSGRRALITMEKGIPGDKVFDEALKAWGVSTAG